MTGESQRDDDFLDDDFIIEDIAAKNEDLDSLFEEGDDKADAHDPANPDAEDLLFTDHSREPKFEGKQQFAEDQKSEWDGQSLDLGSLEGEIEGAKSAAEDPALAAAEQSFTKELDSLLKGEEEFGPDTDGELDVIGADPNAKSDGIAEFEQSGPFVLDDGDGAWQDENRQAAAAAETADASAEIGVPLHASADESTEVEPGWEPLPAANVDQLAEVGEVAPTEDGSVEGELVVDGDAQELTAPGTSPRRPALVGAGVADEVEGHDIYPEDQVAEVVGTRELRRRGVRLFLSIAATFAILAAGAVITLKPEWVGMGVAPEKVQQVEVARPTVAIDVPVPEVVDKPSVAVTPPTPTNPTDPTTPTNPTPVDPSPVDPETAPPTPSPVAVDPPKPEPPEAVKPETRKPESAPEVVSPTPVTPVVQAPSPETQGWPVHEVSPVAAAQQPPTPGKTALLRVDEHLMIGEPDPPPGKRGRATDGVIPGSRAFAQLINGNYFIGSVKAMDAERLTLNVDSGEVTLPVAALARLTELGSADYAELQRVTSGFVRLTNNNRLVGGILSGIADDHVVLEFRSNRVMLPRSLIGQVVQGEGDAGVRLDTTREEDDWLRRLVERQVGSGAPPVPSPDATPLPAPTPDATPTTPPSGMPSATPPKPAATPPKAAPSSKPAAKPASKPAAKPASKPAR